MNKMELLGALSKRSGLSQTDCERVIDAFWETTGITLRSGDKVQMVGYGTFEVRERAERKGRNPQTGEEIIIPATRVVSFKAGTILKDMVK